MDVSPESYARFTAFRQLIYRCSEQLTHNDLHALVYIWMYPEKESYRNASSIAILSRLEATGKFGPWNPEGLLEMMKEIKRSDLCNEVKDFIKMKWLKAAKKGTRRLMHTSDEDLQATFEVVVAQATVLMQQISAFERVLFEDVHAREKAQEFITGATQTAQTLSERLQRAQNELYTPDNDQYVDLDNYRKPRVRSSSFDAASNRKSASFPQTSRTPTHTAFNKINHGQDNSTESELGEYVDMATLKSGKKKQARLTKIPIPPIINTAEYVDMSSLKRKNNVGPSPEMDNSLMLSNCYDNIQQIKSSKSATTVGVSSAVALPTTSQFPLETSPRNEYSVPTSSAGSSRHDSLDVPELPSNPPPTGGEFYYSPDIPELPPNPPPTGGEFYCNLEELQAQVLKLSLNQSFDAVATKTVGTSTPEVPPKAMYIEPIAHPLPPPEPLYIEASNPGTAVPPEVLYDEAGSTCTMPPPPPEAVCPEANTPAPVVPPEAIYSNLSSLNLPLSVQSFPSRDIQRSLQASTSQVPPISVNTTPPERNDSMSSGEEVPLTSSQNSSDSAPLMKYENSTFPPTSTAAERPVLAPKPTIKPKPTDLFARRPSLGHITHMRVRSKAVSRSLKCTSVLNTVKNSVLTHPTETDISADKEIKTKEIPDGSNNYYTQLHLSQQQGISDEGYALVQYH